MRAGDWCGGNGSRVRYVPTYVCPPWLLELPLFKLTQRLAVQPIDWSPPKGERIGGVPPWQGGHLLERTEPPELTEDDLRHRRLKHCVEQWSACESGEYNPACCRFPKSCSPHGRIEAVRVGNLTPDDLEAAA